MTKRKSISKKTRFDVFKRDAFTCQYCGKHAPEVVLHVDHIVAVSNGGGYELTNLVTSCVDCNLGKGPRELDDNAAVTKQSNQLRQLQAKREQIEMIAQWHRSLIDIEATAVNEVQSYYQQLIPGWSLNENGLADSRKYIAKHGLAEVMSAIRKAVANHLKLDENGKVIEESCRITTRVMFNSLKYKEANDIDPIGSQLRYIAGICRNKYPYVPARHREVVADAHEMGIPVEQLKKLALSCQSWSAFENAIFEL
jgi:hypothetical protein